MISSERYQQMLAEDIARMNANALRTDFAVPTAEDDMNWLREERDRKIAATDWTQLPDVPLTDSQVKNIEYFKPDENSEEIKYLKKRRLELGGFIPE